MEKDEKEVEVLEQTEKDASTKKPKVSFSVEMIKDKSVGLLDISLYPKKVIFNRTTQVIQEKNILEQRNLHWDMPTKQIGTIKVERKRTNINRVDVYSLIAFILICLISTLGFLTCLLTKENKMEATKFLLLACSSILLVVSLILIVPFIKKIKGKRFLCLYVESTKNQNSLFLGNPSEDCGYYIRDTEENYLKLLEISEAISDIRK